MDLKLDVKTHDLVFVNGSTPTTTDRVDAVCQRVYIRLRSFLHEWYLLYNYGVPWLQQILGHKTNKATVDMIIQKEILDVEGVQRVVEFRSSFDNSSRAYSCEFKLKIDDGTTTSLLTFMNNI